MADTEQRGRKPVFDPCTRKLLADLMRQNGARRARELAPVSISVGTLLKIAGEHGIKLKKGRRPKSAA
ncbi:MAG: hypothetical protein J5J06_02630 [Phycisphaerae bacterium]|nr:hypothetical protein [Phycisphaerae bacterium]